MPRVLLDWRIVDVRVGGEVVDVGAGRGTVDVGVGGSQYRLHGQSLTML